MLKVKQRDRLPRYSTKHLPTIHNQKANMVQMELGSIDEEQVDDIKVVVRVRPLTKREKDPTLIQKSATGERAYKVIPEHDSLVQLQRNQKIVGREDRKQSKSMFTFDRIFDQGSGTEEVYDFVAKELVEGAVDGRNGSIFAYGQTGSGKTHTMQGFGGSIKDIGINASENQTLKKGLIHMVAEDLFRLIEQVEDRDYVLQVSVIEVYNEEVRDLLSKKADNRLAIREDPTSGVFVSAVRREANSLNKILSILSVGERNRVIARTTLNKKSSRSHIIFSINIESFPVEEMGSATKSNNSKSGYIQRSNLNLIDLAGSESVRHRSAHSTEKRRQEGGSINKSLLTLSLVIQALGAPRRNQIRTGHINYRDSKLTRVLQPALSGKNSRLAFICCVTLSGLYMEETKSTLQFASRIKLIKTKSKINIMDDDVSIGKIQAELKEVKRNMTEMEKGMEKLESENKRLIELLDIVTMQRDEALERALNFEKAKNAAILAASEAEVKRKSETQSGKPPISTNARSGGITGDNQPQPGFLSDMVGKLRSTVNPTQEVDSSAYKKRQISHTDFFEEKKETINGMPALIRADNSKFSVQSEVTNATNYESQLPGNDEKSSENISFASQSNLPMLGLNEAETYSA